MFNCYKKSTIYFNNSTFMFILVLYVLSEHAVFKN